MEPAYIADKELLELPKTAFLCSRHSNCILKCYDRATKQQKEHYLGQRYNSKSSAGFALIQKLHADFLLIISPIHTLIYNFATLIE